MFQERIDSYERRVDLKFLQASLYLKLGSYTKTERTKTMASKNFREYLLAGKQILLDGGIGTELYERGVFLNRCFEEANLSQASLVQEIHKDYWKAGAQALTTNTFGANKLKLKEHSLHDKVKDINSYAVSHIQKASGGEAWILGSIGPLGVRVEPFGPTSLEEAKEIFNEQASALIEAGVDAIALETFVDISELKQAIEGVRQASQEIYLIASIVLNEEGRSLQGTSADWLVQKLDSWNCDAIGFNCAVGPQPMLTTVEKIAPLTQKTLVVRPNAGRPKQVDGRQIYMCTPDYMAHFVQEFLRIGVQVVGGCCGTRPAHIKTMANSMRYAKAMVPVDKRTALSSLQPHLQTEEMNVKVVPLEAKSLWSKALAKGEKAFSVELLPPAGIDPSKIIERSSQIKEAGVHAINIPDGPRASARMSALLTSLMIEEKAGIETVLHYTCRDRNLLGMQSDLLGMQAIGLRNVLIVTGDPPKLGNYPDATGVFDVDAIGLTHMANRLNKGLDLGGNPIGSPASLSLGVGVNPVHRDFSYEMKRFYWKVEAGAEWAITQPVFDLKALYKFLEHIDKEKINIPIVAGIWPLVSYKNALFMNNEVPGVVIPDSTMEQMARFKQPEDAKRVGVEIAHKMVDEIISSVAGIQVSAPFGRINLALAVLGDNLTK